MRYEKMSETTITLGKRIKELVRKGFNIANICRIFTFIFFTWLIMECFFEIIEMQYHYYANTTTSLELISGKQIDRYDGSQFKKETTDQRLLRKMNKKNRFRLRDLRHGYRQIFP